MQQKQTDFSEKDLAKSWEKQYKQAKKHAERGPKKKLLLCVDKILFLGIIREKIQRKLP